MVMKFEGLAVCQVPGRTEEGWEERKKAEEREERNPPNKTWKLLERSGI